MVSQWRPHPAQNIFFIQLVLHAPLTCYVVKWHSLYLSTLEALLPSKMSPFLWLLSRRHRIKKSVWNRMITTHIGCFDTSLTLWSYFWVSLGPHPLRTLIPFLCLDNIIPYPWNLDRFSHRIIEIVTHFSLVHWASLIFDLFMLQFYLVVLPSSRNIKFGLMFC